MPRFQAGLHSPHLCGPYAAVPKGCERQDLQDAKEETKPTGLQVYCDLDGVLADFNKGCLELFPEGGPIAEKIPTHLVTRLSYDEETEMWRRVEAKSDFFLSLDWTSDGEELWRWIDWNLVPSPAILTGLPMGRAGQMASKQKEQWCHDRLGSHVAVFCCGTRNKQKFSGPNCVLIDDRGDLREAWEARGGIFIHHTSALESIRQLREVLKVSHGKVQDEQVPLQLTSVCWAAQTPAGCFKSKCRYLHVPISRRHRCWIQLWGFVWWHQRMFDDLNSLIQCIHAVYSPDHKAAFKGKDDQMDEQSHGAFRKMLETLCECCDLGLPLADIIESAKNGTVAPAPSPLPPLPWQVKEVHSKILKVAQSLEILGDLHLVVAGSMGLGADVGGSDLDLVLCCEIEVDPRMALPALRDALQEAGEASDLLLLDQVLVPLLSFRLGGLSVDITMNQMSSIRDIILFRYALRTAGPELSATLRLLKMWIKARRIPGNKQGGFPNVVWLRMAVRFYQAGEQDLGESDGSFHWAYPRNGGFTWIIYG
ncbi:unnamed protein product [Cladocopium goreaui]|uniref:Geranylgeranyl diphosphate reductase, chloroplastic n=1 Tax=Cladocopium goreaui TaxID=2562237 RepID=A0A9P1BL48_9DINO|nr:unnamed protein product [Cladocopium goreaui]